MSDDEVIAALTRTLTYWEREIIKLRYGLGNFMGDGVYDDLIYTLDEVKRIFKTTRGRIQRIEEKALRKMKGSASSDLLAAVVRRGLAG